MPIETRAPGVYISSAEFEAWLSGTEPLGLASLMPGEVRRLRAQVQRISTLISTDLSTLVESTGTDEAGLTSLKEDAERRREKVADLGGFDTTWGFSELRTCSVMVSSLTLAEIKDLTATVSEVPQGGVDEILSARRAYAIPYPSLLSPDSVDQVRDPAQLVVPPRGEVPFTYDQLAV